MTMTEGAALDVYADPAAERLLTSANVITVVRTVAAVVLAGLAIQHESLPLLVSSLVVYWVGDILDGLVARLQGCETRIGAVLDVLSDRFCAAAFYFGLAWPIRSPNYFYVVDRTIWLWNWSKPAKAANSAIFAVILLVTGMPLLGLAIAVALLVLKCVSLARLARVGLPVPAR